MMGLFSPDIVWQEFNPYLKLQIQGIPDSWVFCRREAPGGENSINDESPITAGLSEIFFPVPGGIKPDKSSDLKFTKLVSTGEVAGTMSYQSFMDNRENPPFLMKVAQGDRKGPQTIAARITGKPPEDKPMSDAGAMRRAAKRPRSPRPARGQTGGGGCQGRAETGRQARSQGRKRRRKATGQAEAKGERSGGEAEAPKPEAKEPKEPRPGRGVRVRYRPDDARLPPDPRSARRGRRNQLAVRERQLPAEHHRRVVG